MREQRTASTDTDSRSSGPRTDAPELLDDEAAWSWVSARTWELESRRAAFVWSGMEFTDDELELWHWGAQHINGLRTCGGTLTVSGYLSILRQIRDSEQLR